MIRVVYLYPQQLNIYGERGNVLALLRRCQWRGIEAREHQVGVGDNLEFKAGDILFVGGGQDRGQQRVAADLRKRGAKIRSAVAGGLPVLTICGGYQLFGHDFKDQTGNRLEGIGVFDAHTVAGPERLIGNLVIESKHFGQLVGFENHSGQTYLGEQVAELGVVKKGYGNNGQDRGEGALVHHAIGTYMHGSFLPKNPGVADWLISAALHQLGHDAQLKPLDDSLEALAAKRAAARPH